MTSDPFACLLVPLSLHMMRIRGLDVNSATNLTKSTRFTFVKVNFTCRVARTALGKSMWRLNRFER